MRLFAILVATAVLAVGVTLELPKTTAAGYFDATFHLQNALAEYGTLAFATVRNLTIPTPSIDSYHRNYTTLLGIINFSKPIYDEIVQSGLNQTELELHASNHSRLVEMNHLLNESRKDFAIANRYFATFQGFLQGMYENYQKEEQYQRRLRFLVLTYLAKFYEESELALTKWADVLEKVGTPNMSWGLERFRQRGGVNEILEKWVTMFDPKMA